MDFRYVVHGETKLKLLITTAVEKICGFGGMLQEYCVSITCSVNLKLKLITFQRFLNLLRSHAPFQWHPYTEELTGDYI